MDSDPVHILMDNGGGPWTRGPCFVLSRRSHIPKLKTTLIHLRFWLHHIKVPVGT